MGNLQREAAEPEARLRAEAERERKRLQEVLAQAPAAIGLLNGAEHRWVYVNNFFVQVTGRQSAQDFLGKTVRESFPEGDGQGYSELLDRVYRTGEPFTSRETKTIFNRTASGRNPEAHFDLVYQPIRGIDHEIEGILVHAIEVTDQVIARKKLEHNEERLRMAQAAGQMGTWEWNSAHDTSTLSPELYRIFGIATDDPQHEQIWASRVDPEDLPRIEKEMRDGYQSGSLEFEYRYHHPRRGLRWFYCKGRRLTGELSMFGILQDITERKQIEETRHRLAAIVESSDDAIVSKNLNGIVTSWNAGAERIFGYTAEEMIGQPITKIIPQELHRDEDMILGKIRSGEKIDHFETVRVGKSGEPIEVSLSISPVRDERGKIIGAAKIARDITEHKKVEQALRTAEKLAAAGRLASTVAHEINNPLEAVTNLVYLAKRALPDDAKARSYLQQATRELERVAHIARQTLGFYRDTSTRTTFKLSRTLDELLFLYEKRFETLKIEVIRDYRDEIEVFGSSGEIRQAFSNLVSNSIDAMPGGGTLVIRVSSSRRWNNSDASGVRITVLDTGSGIASEHKKNLFQPFFTTKTDVGTGLGLWITYNIVGKNGGIIRVKSRTGPEKHGTVFSIFLPTVLESASQEEERRLAGARP